MSINAGDIVWQLKAEMGNFNAGLANARGKMSGFADKIRARARQIGMAMTAMGGLITGALANTVKSWASYGDAIAKAALRTGLSTEALSILAHAAEQSGTSMQSVEKAVKRMAKVLLDAERGLSTGTDALEGLGLTLDDFKGKSPEQAFGIFADAIMSIEDPLMKSAKAQEVFGRAGTELIPMIIGGSQAMAEWTEQAHRLGKVMSQEEANKAAAWTDAIHELSGAWTGLKNAVAPLIVAYLQPLVERMKEWVIAAREWVAAHPELVAWIAKLTMGGGALMLALGPLLVLLPGIIAGFAALTSGTGVVAAAIGLGLVAAIWKFRDRFGDIKNWVFENMERIKATMARGWETLKLIFEVGLEMLRGIVTAIGAIFFGWAEGQLDFWTGIVGDSEKGTGDFLDQIDHFLKELEPHLKDLKKWMGEAADKVVESWDDIVAWTKWADTAIMQPVANMIATFQSLIGTIKDVLYWAKFLSPLGLLAAGKGKIDNPVVGFAAGGVVGGGGRGHQLAMVGERGPELAALPVGTRVMSNQDMKSAVRGGGGGAQISIVFNGDMKLDTPEDMDRLSQKLASDVGRELRAAGVGL